jgi:hypothetical protein
MSCGSRAAVNVRDVDVTGRWVRCAGEGIRSVGTRLPLAGMARLLVVGAAAVRRGPLSARSRKVVFGPV